MEFIDLKAQYQRLEGSIRSRLDAVLAHGHYIMGPEIHELEERLAEYVGAKHCISCASGSDALLMALMAWDIGPGDAVFVPAFSFFATAEMPALLGATPIFVDIEAASFNMDPASLRCAVEAVRTQDPALHPLPPAALGPKPLRARCVIPVDLFGQAAAYEKLLPLAESLGLVTLEDGAQAFGGTWQGHRVCGLGCTAGASSFFPAKPLGCYGDGGALFTDDAALAAEYLSIRTHGKGTDKYNNRRIGINGRLDTMQAAVLLSKLDIFDDEIARRQRVALWYARALSKAAGLTNTGPDGAGFTGIEGLSLPHVAPERRSVFAQYTVRVSGGQRDKLAAALQAQGIPTNIYYPKPLHMQEAFAAMGYHEENMPVTARACREVLSLPFHPYMDEEQVERICHAIARYF